MKSFNIQMAAQVSGLSTHTIRAWEKRYNALTPARSTTGRRQYSQEDIERLTLLSQLTNMGNSIGQIAHLDDQELNEIYESLTKSQRRVYRTMNQAPANVEINLETTINNLTMALSAYKVDIISHELGKAKNALSPKQFALSILHPLITQIKKYQNNGTLNFAQIRTLNAILKFHAGNIIYGYYERKLETGKKITLATPEGELEVLDIMMAALLCVDHHLNFFYLSSNLPAESVSEAANALDSDIIILSVCCEKCLKMPLNEYLDELAFKVNQKTEIWLVGHANFANIPFLNSKNIRVFHTFEEMDQVLSNTN